MIRPLADLPARLGGYRGVMVDSNILIDIAFQDEHWYGWSSRALSECLQHSLLFINPIVYAEVSLSYNTIDELDAALPSTLFRREALPWAAGFLAGKSFQEYRRRGGTRTSPLPDFYIGAHAASTRLALLTRDIAGFRSYFPTVELLAPA